MDQEVDSIEAEATVEDPRSILARWANRGDEWIRYLVGQVLSTGRPVGDSDVDYAYQLFRQSKALDSRTLPAQPVLAVEPSEADAEVSLSITKLSDVQGVNALAPGATIEPHQGLTILYGENGTGKTGYSRIFKTLAGSRTADRILGDIAAEVELPVQATVDYSLDGDQQQLLWKGEASRAPFTRMSIFDSPAVTFHVDDDLEYVYVPSVLSLFNHVTAAIRAVQQRIEDEKKELTKAAPSLLARFPNDDVVHPQIETLGASTDLSALQALAIDDPKSEVKVVGLQTTIGSLQSNTLAATLTALQRRRRVLTQAEVIRAALEAFDVSKYNETLDRISHLKADRGAFRTTFFAAADLPSKPDDTWEAFVASGATYQEHLVAEGTHDDSRCLYCRQPLEGAAQELITRYSDYLLDKIGEDLAEAEEALPALARDVRGLASDELHAFVNEFQEQAEKPDYFDQLERIDEFKLEANNAIAAAAKARKDLVSDAHDLATGLASQITAAGEAIAKTKDQIENRDSALAERRAELLKLQVGMELTKSWIEIDSRVSRAKQADKLTSLAKSIPTTLRALTDLSKSASDHLINENFDKLFAEECEALRAPVLKVEYIGRDAKAQRRKVLSGKHRPSKVLSEGEQKVLAMADFLAEARLSGISAPVVFDDPVSSLDHRRINEVANRITKLAEKTQVIVFTHDVLFAAALLSRFEKTKRCRFYQVTDQGGKGKVSLATGPRWDTVAELKKRVNVTIELAKKERGEAQDALVRTGYDWLRSWCEVFTEMELLGGVSQRYQPNIRMGTLEKINSVGLPAAIEAVTRVFDDACRYIDGHSQPLAALNVTPTLADLEKDWADMQAVQKAYASGN